MEPHLPDEPAERNETNLFAIATKLWRSSATRYLAVGGLAFVIDAGGLWLLHQLFQWPLWLASGTSFLAGFAFSYLVQRTFSFQSDAPHGRGLLRYILLLAFNTLATILIVQLFDVVGLGWGPGKIVAAVVTTGWNYFLYRWWVFPARSPSAE